MKVCILGCGPAGLLAAHAVHRLGHQPIIYSVKQKSEMPGAIYLHRPIPGLTLEEPEELITYSKWGGRAGYAFKVYGETDAPCSWDEFEPGPVGIWSLKLAYSELWDRYKDSIRERYISAEYVSELLIMYRYVICSIPAPFICRDTRNHLFERREVWITREADDAVKDNHIVYNGLMEMPWYRSSRIFGHGSTEYGMKNPVDGAVLGVKPIKHNCSCWNGTGLVRVGRFGKWEKGILAHQAFEDTAKLLEERDVVHSL